MRSVDPAERQEFGPEISKALAEDGRGDDVERVYHVG
jgi:hypothetical protein